MENLNYEVLKKSGYEGFVLKDAPEKVLQFGEGTSSVHLLITGLILPMKKQAGTESAASYSRSLRVLQS